MDRRAWQATVHGGVNASQTQMSNGHSPQSWEQVGKTLSSFSTGDNDMAGVTRKV